jgi:hypothetical protein
MVVVKQSIRSIHIWDLPSINLNVSSRISCHASFLFANLHMKYRNHVAVLKIILKQMETYVQKLIGSMTLLPQSRVKKHV